MATTGRLASVVLVHRGEVLGLLPPIALEMPWWPEAHDLVTAVRERDGIEITVLRLLQTTSDRIDGGKITTWPRPTGCRSRRSAHAWRSGCSASESPGEPAALRPMVSLLTDLQQRGLDRLEELVAIGVPDRRLETMVPRIAAVVEQWGSGLDEPERRSVDALVSGLPVRLATIAECGVPDTLVHGDFHPGNVAGRPGHYVILN